ncbi:hypothetical protein PUMCH_001518 [Australozyma saopauloensis]|uniref:Pre-mRNA-processing factor 39 n=1 Tax=Australozyma saopauloensis TaxID=291208 RepID=A0AAX4H6Q1_9ASCO|nr:hypothetical protein PUMCH_001518 [[Candida] saopauloensis]
MENQNDWQGVSLALLKDPHNFKLWQQFVYTVEHQNGTRLDVTSSEAQKTLLRQVYESFLRKYPYICKYWISFAGWERKLDGVDRAEAVFQQGLRFLSLDLHYWVAYLNFLVETISSNVEEVADLFERAREKIGFNYYAYEFYSLYIEFLKTYHTSENKFLDKLALLFRLTMEIPLYDYSSLYKELILFVQPQKQSLSHLTSFLGEANLKTMRKECNNNNNLILQKLNKIITDAYIVVQSQSFEIYAFEKEIPSPVSYTPERLLAATRELWHRYLSFAEYNFPFSYVAQLFDRCVYLTSDYTEFYESYVDYLIKFDKLSLAKSVLNTGCASVSSIGGTVLLLRLVDLEIYEGNVIRARDLLASFIAHNKSTPLCIYDKLLEVEALLSRNDEQHLCLLAKELIKATKSTTYFRKIAQFDISNKTLAEFFLLFISDPQELKLEESKSFWEQLQKCADNSQLESVTIPESFAKLSATT